MLPLALRSEHDLNKFGFGLKGTLDPSQIEPTILLLYLVVPFFLFVLFCVIVFCVVFSFHQGPIQTSLTELGTSD